MASYIWLIWDITGAVIIFFIIKQSARFGFIRTLISFLSYFISAFSAKVLSPVIASLLYKNIVKDAVVIYIEEKLKEQYAGNENMAEAILGFFPKIITQNFNLDIGGLISSPESKNMIGEMVDSALASPIMYILEVITFFAVFSIAALLLRHVSYFFSGLHNVPVIGSIDTVLGGIIGVLKAAVILFLLAFLGKVVIDITANELDWINTGVIENTYIWRFYYKVFLKI